MMMSRVEVELYQYFEKTKRPIITAVIAEIKTAPAATSLAFSIRGWISGTAASDRNSIDVLRASATQTVDITTIILIQSEVSIL
jgi:hypothetical protein